MSHWQQTIDFAADLDRNTDPGSL